MNFIIFGVVSVIFTAIFELIPSSDVVEIALQNGDTVLDSFLDYVHCACYLLPMGTVSIILTIFVALMVFRIVVAALTSLWNVLPFV